LHPSKFRDPFVTAKGERRATVALRALETLWFNTGTLCNLACKNCYIESSPTNDRLAYLSLTEVRAYIDEIRRDRLPTRVIGFTGGEPFMNPEITPMLEEVLSRGFEALVLTNAMKPMAKAGASLLAIRSRYGEQLTVRVSIDHYSASIHDLERGTRTWQSTLAGLTWLVTNGFKVHVASRQLSGEPEGALRDGFARLFERNGVPIDAADPVALVIFPEMDATVDVPEITEACWGILSKSPEDVMCSSSRMVVKRNGEDKPSVLACTLLPYDKQFELGHSLAEASSSVALNHPHCAKFCVLGGGACSR
jgi:uncharacterized Fe-S cluster-containing radical SAM superfamily protein